MPPNLCPCCGLPLAVNEASEPIPCCPISPEMELHQREIWAEYDRAQLLQTLDFYRLVATDMGNMSLMTFLQNYHHAGLVWESVPKTTGTILLQIVYLKGQGCKLLKWPFARPM
jgi:hypothetical protein